MVDFNVCPHCSDEGLQIDHLGATCPAAPAYTDESSEYTREIHEKAKAKFMGAPSQPHAGGRDLACPGSFTLPIHLSACRLCGRTLEDHSPIPEPLDGSPGQAGGRA